MANAVTASRLIAALAMAFLAASSPAFWMLFAWCGLSDMVDGTIARRLGEQSDFGAKLDSAADFIFAAICLAKILPALQPPIWLIAWIALIALCKLVGYASGPIMHGRAASLHTAANKVAGLLVFVSIPIMLLSGLAVTAVPACAVATFAAIQEGYLVCTGQWEEPGQCWT